MRPILFDKSARDFTTNGLGRIECVSCEVSWSANGSRELEAVVSVTSPHVSEIVNDNIIAAIPYDGGTLQAFRIYKVTKPLSGTFTVYARHISSWLSYIPCRPFTAETVTEALQKLKTNAMEECPFTFWTDKNTRATYTQDAPESILSRLGGVQGSILDVYGGDYDFDNFNVRLWNNFGRDQSVAIRYGKNLTDINQEASIESTVTGIVPFWASESEVIYYNGVVEADTANNFAHKRTVPYDFSDDFEEAPTAAQLKARAERYVIRNKIGIPKVNIKVSFVALWQTEEYKEIAPLERLRVFDYVTVYYPKLDISAKAQIIKTRYDCLRDRYVEIELGELRSDFANTIVGLTDALTSKQNALVARQNRTFANVLSQSEEIREIKDNVADLDEELGNVSQLIDDSLAAFEKKMDAAIEAATDEITGANGGYIVTHQDSAGRPYELLIMEKPDINDPNNKNIWRWNMGGLGYSKNGYGGPYETAITQKGAINAKFITTGTLDAGIITTGILKASLIKAGVLMDSAGKNFWNMESGAFKTDGGTFNNIKAVNGKMTNVSATGGTFTNITASGGQFNNIRAQGGVFNQIQAIDISATGSLSTSGRDDGSGTPFMNLIGGRLAGGRSGNEGGAIDFENSINNAPAMRINSPRLFLTGDVYTSKSTSTSGTIEGRQGMNFSANFFTYDIDFTGSAIADDIDCDWTNIGLEFVNGLLVEMRLNGNPLANGTVLQHTTG